MKEQRHFTSEHGVHSLLDLRTHCSARGPSWYARIRRQCCSCCSHFVRTHCYHWMTSRVYSSWVHPGDASPTTVTSKDATASAVTGKLSLMIWRKVRRFVCIVSLRRSHRGYRVIFVRRTCGLGREQVQQLSFLPVRLVSDVKILSVRTNNLRHRIT